MTLGKRVYDVTSCSLGAEVFQKSLINCESGGRDGRRAPKRRETY